MDFNQKAISWDKDPLKIERAEIFASEVRKLTGKRKIHTAFEFGCGTGLVSFFLKDRFTEIILADNSTGMIDVLKKKILEGKATNLHPVLLDENNRLDSFSGIDIIYTFMAMHHVKDTDRTAGLFYGMLKPGGLLVIGDLYPEDGSFHNVPEFDGHYGFDPAEMGESLMKKGFKNLNYRKLYTITRFRNGLKKEYPLFILSVQKHQGKSTFIR